MKVENILKSNGFNIKTSDSALNIYDKTIVYYRSGNLSYAQELVNLLTDFIPSIQELKTPTDYDLIIVIGNKIC